MRRLKHQQRVEIHLDGADGVVSCRVLGVSGSVASLARVDGGPEQFERLTPAAPGYLMFEHRGGTIALKGIATTEQTDQPELLFVVLDGVQLPERRSAERVELSALARMFLPDGAGDDDCVETPLANLSTSGLLVGAPSGPGRAGSIQARAAARRRRGPDPVRRRSCPKDPHPPGNAARQHGRSRSRAACRDHSPPHRLTAVT